MDTAMEFKELSYLYEWPESERLKKVIYVEAPKLEHCYTMPGIKSNVPLEDLLATKAEELLHKSMIRPTVSLDKDGLKLLIASGHLRSAINLTTKLLTDLGQGIGMAGQPSRNSFETFEVWACRFQLLMAIKCYSLLNDELSPFEELDAPDLYTQYYPHLYNNHKGTIIPFSLRLVHAESLRFTPFPWAAVQRINILEENVVKVIEMEKEKGASSEELNAWKHRLVAVQKLKARTLYFLKEYSLSMMLYNRIFVAEENEGKKLGLKLLLARIAAVVGDEKSLLRFLKGLPLTSGSEDAVQLHRSLKSVFYGQYNKAVEQLKSSMSQMEDPRAWNNVAVCLLYSGRVTEALKIFEKCFDTPNEPLLLNLVSINELTARDIKQRKTAIFEENVEKLSDIFDPVVLKLSQ